MSEPACDETNGSTRRGWVVDQILNSIFTGEFRGGDRLVEQEIASTMSVSRTPVREAFRELAGVGLIVLRPNHGAVVRPWGPRQIREVYHIRWLLEAEAARNAASHIDLTALRTIRERTQEFTGPPRSGEWASDAIALDQQFHQFIADSCGSVRLAEEIGKYRSLVRSIIVAVGNIGRAQEVAVVEHLQIIDQLLKRNGDGAAAAMVQHIQRGTEAAVKALFSAGHLSSSSTAAFAASMPAGVDVAPI